MAVGKTNLSFFRKIAYQLEFRFFQLIALFLNLLPFPAAVRVGQNFGVLLFHLLSRRRRIATENLRHSFPEKTEAEIEVIARNSFKNLARVGVEFVCIPKLIRKGRIPLSNKHWAWEALQKKHGLLLIASHLTNWEVMAVSIGMEGLPVYAIGRPIKNPYVYNYIKKMRGMGGMISIDKSGAIRGTVKLIKKNKMVAFFVDQHERQGSVRVQFFGRACYASGLPARMALKWDIPVIATFCYRDGYRILTTDFEAPFDLIRTGDEEADIKANTQLFTDRIEQQVRARPGEWLWMHRRWRA